MPYFIQLLADEVQQLDFENKELNSENLEKAVEKVFKSEEFGLEEFHSRLDTYLKDENLEKPAKIILSHISNDELDFDDLYAFVDNHVSKERLAELLNRLEDEAYLKKKMVNIPFSQSLWLVGGKRKNISTGDKMHYPWDPRLKTYEELKATEFISQKIIDQIMKSLHPDKKGNYRISPG